MPWVKQRIRLFYNFVIQRQLISFKNTLTLRTQPLIEVFYILAI